MMVTSKQSKRAVIFKGNINRGDFDNINYDYQKTEEYDDDDNDERRPVIRLSDGDIV